MCWLYLKENISPWTDGEKRLCVSKCVISVTTSENIKLVSPATSDQENLGKCGLILRLDKVFAHTLGCTVSYILLLYMIESVNAYVYFDFINLQLESPAQYLLL